MSEKGLLALKRSRFLLVLILFVFGALARNAFSQASPQRVIIDTDPGTDDSMAILLGLNSPELKVEAFTVVPGNVDARQGLENALKIVSLAGRCDVPVASVGPKINYGTILARKEWPG